MKSGAEDFVLFDNTLEGFLERLGRERAFSQDGAMSAVGAVTATL
jgi:hypothetical protein